MSAPVDKELTFTGMFATRERKGFPMGSEPRVIWQSGMIGSNINSSKEETVYRIVAWGYGSSADYQGILTAFLHFERSGRDALGVPAWLPLSEADSIKPDFLVLAAIGDLTLGNLPDEYEKSPPVPEGGAK